MARPTKLTAELAEEICEYARKGLPVRRAAALVGVHRVSAQRWMRQGALEIAEAADDDGELTPQAAFAISFDAARAEYLLGLSAAWQSAIARKEPHVAKCIQVMMASQAPDEYSERRVTRTVDQTTTLAGEIRVSRFDTMTDDDLRGERSKIAARVAAGEAGAGAASWQDAAVRMPSSPVGTEDAPGPAAGKNNSTVEKPIRSVSNRKTRVGALGVDDPGLSQKISSTRARKKLALRAREQQVCRL